MSDPAIDVDDGAGAGAADLPGLKAPDALRTIGEVATALGIRQHVLRYWEEQFPTLSPIKRSGGRRYYRPEDMALLRTIHRLVDQEGYTLRGARLAIEAGAGKAVPAEDGAVSAAPPPVATSVTPAPAPAVMSADALVHLRRVRRVLADALAAS